MHSFVQMVCWNQNKAFKSEPKWNIIRRNRNKVGYLQGRCYILVVLLIVIYFAWKQACHFHTALWGFLTSFMPLGSIYWWNAVRRAFCVIALSVKQSDPLLQHLLALTPTYSYSYAASYLLLSGLWVMCLLLCFLPVFAHHWLVIFHLLSYTVITGTACTSMIENEKYVPSVFNPVCAKRGWGLF